MALTFNPNNWATGDLLTADKLNGTETILSSTVTQVNQNTTNIGNLTTTLASKVGQSAIDSAISTLKGGVSTDGDTLAKLKTLIDNIESVLTSDDTTLDTLQEVVSYIKSEKGLIDSLTSGKVNVTDIIDALESTDIDKVLSANQGNIIKKNIGVSITDYPKLNGETSDSPRIQRAVDANPNTKIFFPTGTYEIATKITITNQVSLELSHGAIFKATTAMDYMINWDGGSNNIFSEYSMHIIGGVMDGSGIAGGISLGNIHHFTHEFTWYKDCTIGLNVGTASDFKTYEGIFKNLYFRNTVGIDDSIAINLIYKGDHHFEDIIIVDYTTGIKNVGYSNRFTRCHYWCTNIIPNMAKTIAFDTSGSDAIFTDCYADTGHIGFKVNGDTRIVNATGYHNTTYGGTGHISIQYGTPTARLLLIGGSFAGDGTTDIFFDGTLSTNVYMSNIKLNGFIKGSVYDNRVYSAALNGSMQTEFLTLTCPKTYNVDLNFDMYIRSPFGRAVLNSTLNSSGTCFTRCLDSDVSKNFRIIMTSDTNNYYFHFYAVGGSGTLYFEFDKFNGNFYNASSIALNTRNITAHDIFTPNEGATGQQASVVSGTEVIINGQKAVNTNILKLGSIYLWDAGANHIRYSTTYPTTLATDGAQLI